MGIPRQLQERLDGYGQAKQTTVTDAAATGSTDGAAAPASPNAGEHGDASAAPLDTSHADVGETDTSGLDAAPQDTPANDLVWRRTEGRYKAQVKRLEDRISELTEHARGTTVIADLLQQTRAELAELRAGKAGAKPDEPAKPDPTELSDEERDMFGEFLPVAQKIIDRTSAPLRAKIDELEKQTGVVGHRAMQADEQIFVNRVRARVPQFDDIVNDPDWVEYTKGVVPLTKMTLFDALQDAHNARDLDRVTNILHAFASTHTRNPAAAGKPQTTTSTANNATAGAANAAPSNATGLAQFATPERTAANPAGKPTAKFRASDYQARLSDLRARRITTTEFEQFDKEFQQARRAGLVA